MMSEESGGGRKRKRKTMKIDAITGTLITMYSTTLKFTRRLMMTKRFLEILRYRLSITLWMT